MYTVVFECVDVNNIYHYKIIKSNYKTYEKNVNKCKAICKKNNEIFLSIISIE